MRKFIVERPLPNIGDATHEEQLSMAKVSDEIIEQLGTANIRWVESIFAADKAYCFYYARDLETVREHSRWCWIRTPALRARHMFRGS